MLIAIGVTAAYAAFLALVIRLCRVGHQHNTPTLLREEDVEYPRCHYCDETVMSEPISLTCPNCKTPHTFHTGCGFDLRHSSPEPKCKGMSVNHASGHIINLTYPNMCGRCNLGKLYWDEWNCADNAAQLERSLFIERRKNK